MSKDSQPIKPINEQTLALSTLNDQTLSLAMRHKEVVKQVTGVATDDPSKFLMKLANEAKDIDQELAYKCATEVLKNQTKMQENLIKMQEKGESQASVNINMNAPVKDTGPTFDLEDM